MGIPIEVIESGNPVVGLRELKRRLAGRDRWTSSTATAPVAT